MVVASLSKGASSAISDNLRMVQLMTLVSSPLKSLEPLLRLGILETMAEQTNRVPRWSDILVERLRSGCGSAISGQIRGRGVEDFAEAIVRKVFDDQFVARCTFTGPRAKRAKCDFAIPSKADARILIAR
jgi:hypothetical protein